MAIPITQDFKDFSKIGDYAKFAIKLRPVCITAGIDTWSYSTLKATKRPLWLTMNFKDQIGFGAGKMEWHFSAYTDKGEVFINAYNWAGMSSKAYALHFQKALTKHGIKSRVTKLNRCDGVAIPMDEVIMDI